MNKTLSFDILLFLVLLFLAFAALGNETENLKTDSDPVASQAILEAYQFLKAGDNIRFDQSMQQMGYSLEKRTHEETSPGTYVDTLVFQRKISNDWVFFRVVDLEYVRVISGFLSVSSNSIDTVLNQVLTQVGEKNVSISRMEQPGASSIEIVDREQHIVIDDRWKSPTETIFNSLFTYEIRRTDQYAELIIEEIAPSQSRLVNASKRGS